MSTFDIHLFSTAALEGAHGWTPVENAETYLQEAWNQISGHDANIDVIYDDVYAPTQKSQEQITDVPHPCLSGAYTDYDDLLSWWLDYVHCQVSDSDTAADINCLITDAAPNGDVGIGNSIQSDPPVCVSEGGPSLNDLPVYQDHGSDWGGRSTRCKQSFTNADTSSLILPTTGMPEALGIGTERIIGLPCIGTRHSISVEIR